MAKDKKTFAFTQPELKLIVAGLDGQLSEMESLEKKCRAAGQDEAADSIRKEFKGAKDLTDNLKLELEY